MSSILDTSSLYSTYSQSLAASSTSSLESSISNVSEDTEDDELMEVCKSFESYFVQKIIEQAKSSIAGSEDEDGEYMQYFGDILNEQYADAIVESGSTGLAQQLYDSMKNNLGL
ncbi:MAG: rod-binding protein [Clostridiaceae bacterium]|nr:rod-binding protein [Clostridiaceae bacterium]